MTLFGLVVGEVVTPETVAFASRALTAVLGLFVAGLAYRGYRQNDAPKMRFLAVGIALLTTGVFAVVFGLDWTGVREGIVLVARGIVTVIGLSAVLYALIYDGRH